MAKAGTALAAERILILGGTAEAAELAAMLDADPDFDPITSLAGRTRAPAPLPGAVRTGGFGGSEGLARFVSKNGVDRVVDATHPFAELISQNAITACRATGARLLRLERPAWRPEPSDRWIDAPDVAAAVDRLPSSASRVFLSIGRQRLAPFARRPDLWYLLRAIDPADSPPPLPRYEQITGHGPFAEQDEAELLSRHRIDTLVSRNSGGNASYAKIAAARRLGLPVVMIDRPRGVSAESVATVRAVLGWLRHS